MIASWQLRISLLFLTIWISPSSGLGQDVGKPSDSSPGQSQPASYDTWLKSWREYPLHGALGDRHTILLCITQVIGDDIVPARATTLFRNNPVEYDGVAISTVGTVSAFRFSSGGAQGGSGDLPKKDFASIKLLLKSLPDDHLHLPPPGHRIVVQLAAKAEIEARVYDRAHLPQTILDLIRLSSGRFNIDMPVFKPSKRFNSEEVQLDVLEPSAFLPAIRQYPLATFTQNSQHTWIAVQDQWSQSLRIFAPHSNTPIHEIVQPPESGSFPWTHARQFSFSPDGKLFLLSTTRPNLFLYDTNSWLQVRNNPLIPRDAVIYLPNPDWTEGVAVSSSGKVSLWNAQTRRDIAELDLEKDIQIASYSPDNSRVLILAGPSNSRLIRASLWDTSNGTLLHEIWPVEWTSALRDKPVWWWNQGRILVAPYTSMFNDPAIGLWDVSTGMYLGTLERCKAKEAGDPFVLDGLLFVRCQSGAVLEWDLAEVHKTIADFSGPATQ